MIVKKPPCDRFAPIAGEVAEGFGVPKPGSSPKVFPGGRDTGVRHVEHHHEIEREMDGRNFKYRESTRNAIFEQNHISGLEIGNQIRPATNLEENGHQIGLGVKHRLNRLLRERQSDQQYGCEDCSARLGEHIGETLEA